MRPSTRFPRSITSRACLAGLIGFALLGSDPAEAQFGQASPHTLELNHVFYFNGDKAAYAKPPDCKAWPEAMQAFDALRAAGKAITTVRGKDKVAAFVEHAYAERLRPVQYVDLESVFVEPVGEDRYRVYTGNEPKQVVCGFDQPQFLDKLWLDAGLESKAVPVKPRLPSPLDPLRTAYWMESYGLVRSSLLQRGYTAVAIPESVAQRCTPKLEGLCETWPEALCEAEGLSGATCTFVFRRDGTRELVGIDAIVGDLTEYTARITVTGLRELGERP
ncbi:hypothetical protein MKK63_11425 [Methylobacterium sp. J-088]|uniref:hypothetical protein n=1 Tax=Methylobacterium sp. J-088 TaxID=2836664 RepID=UPI001FB91979|nr:hypothetical protein [Methylobacterium sp. J-088]MCJ2063319.1 hypothetical protein [Methylobacterium sp. J-088]